MDTKFAVAVHILVMLSEADRALSSQDLARSVHTNASHIRKLVSLLKQAGLISSSQGVAGYQVTKPAQEISLDRIYQAIYEQDRVQIFHQHSSPNQECPVGRYIGGALSPVFQEVEMHLTHALSQQSLSDVIANLYEQAQKERGI